MPLVVYFTCLGVDLMLLEVHCTSKGVDMTLRMGVDLIILGVHFARLGVHFTRLTMHL